MHDQATLHYQRAEAEVLAAERATCVEAVQAHCRLAGLHFAAMHGVDQTSDGTIASPDRRKPTADHA